MLTFTRTLEGLKYVSILNQQDLGKIVGHNKAYTSELMNAVKPFSMKDLVIIHVLFKIEFKRLIPPFLDQETTSKVIGNIEELHKPEFKNAVLSNVSLSA